MKIEVNCFYNLVAGRENFENELEQIDIYRDEIYLYHISNEISLRDIFILNPEYFSCHNLDDINDWNSVYGLTEEDGLELRDGYEIYTSRGYSQGDICIIIHEKVESNEAEFHQYLDNLCWDQPVTINVIIDGKEEFCQDSYFNEWNKDEIIKDILDQLKYSDEEMKEIKNKLMEEIPEDPSEIEYM